MVNINSMDKKVKHEMESAVLKVLHKVLRNLNDKTSKG